MNTKNTIDGIEYIRSLTDFVKRHESKFAEFVQRAPVPTSTTTTPPSWSTILSLGIIPTGSSSTTTTTMMNQRERSSFTTIPKSILTIDPHHLYFLLLKFDELKIDNLGRLDLRIEQGFTRPISIDFGLDTIEEAGGARSESTNWLTPFSSSSSTKTRNDSDNASFRSGISTFSLGSGWWGSSKNRSSASFTKEDEENQVKYLYSSCTKLPALKLVPFSPSTLMNRRLLSNEPNLNKWIKDFTDCPPERTTVPLDAFKNLSTLVLDDLDPRTFSGWDRLSRQLKSFEVHNGGIEDLGTLICTIVVEDHSRRQRELGNELFQAEEQDQSRDYQLEEEGETYPIPPSYAWSQLRHLSLSNNSLTFIPSSPLLYLSSSLTSLDLSSNLLISIPPGLKNLHSLKSLNLNDNMIDSLIGIPKILGAIQVLNLGSNRLSNLAGLERLLALERIDLRSNRLEEALEISRLNELPMLKEIWIRSNPFTKSVEQGGEENWRIKCEAYFEGEVRIDGVEASSSRVNGNGNMDHRLRKSNSFNVGGAKTSLGNEEARSTVGEAKIVSRRIITTPQLRTATTTPTTKNNNTLLSSPEIKADELNSSPYTTPNKNSTNLNSSITTTTTRSATRKPPRRIVDLDQAENDSSSPSDLDQSHHHHHHHHHHNHNHYYEESSNRSKSLSASFNKSSSKRRERLSVSTFEPSLSHDHEPYESQSRSRELSGGGGGGGGGGKDHGGEAFRKRIEQLRNEVGESWLSVLGEREERESGGETSSSGRNRRIQVQVSKGIVEKGKEVERALEIDEMTQGEEVQVGEMEKVIETPEGDGATNDTAEEAIATTVTKVVKVGASGSAANSKNNKKKKKKSNGKKK